MASHADLGSESKVGHPLLPQYTEPLPQQHQHHSASAREQDPTGLEGTPSDLHDSNKRKGPDSPEPIVISSSDDEHDCDLPRKRPRNNLAYETSTAVRQTLQSSTPSSQASPIKTEGQNVLPDSDPNHISIPSPSTFQDREADPPAARSPDEVQLCPEQAYVVELAKSGRNVFYTGSAGCGKSTVLREIVKGLRAKGKKVWILAPTGRAALQVNGSTTWTYAGWTPDHHKRTLGELRRAAHGKFVWQRLAMKTDVVIIDEISMVENLHLERLNEVMKEARHNPSLKVQPAFGGAQMIVTGDFCQLPPVKPFQHCIECGRELSEGSDIDGTTYTCPQHGVYHDKDKWAFRSKAWDECNFEHVHLKNIHRQSDPTFIRILQKCRVGTPFSAKDIDILMNHDCMVQHATRLFATKDEVKRVNQAAFSKLTGTTYSYWCLDTFLWQKKHPHLQFKDRRGPGGPPSQKPLLALQDHRFDEFVELKKGMLVVLLVNLDLPLGLCNGSQGLICGFEKYDASIMPKAITKGKDDLAGPRIFGDRAQLKEAQIKEFIMGPGAKFKYWPVVKFHNGQTRTIYADCSINELGDEQPYSLLCRTQIPLAPAWAMTIHKSQSLTMPRVRVDVTKAFEQGQVYVALSRATCLEGLKIDGDATSLSKALGGDPEVQRFHREKFGALNTLCDES